MRRSNVLRAMSTAVLTPQALDADVGAQAHDSPLDSCRRVRLAQADDVVQVQVDRQGSVAPRRGDDRSTPIRSARVHCRAQIERRRPRLLGEVTAVAGVEHRPRGVDDDRCRRPHRRRRLNRRLERAPLRADAGHQERAVRQQRANLGNLASGRSRRRPRRPRHTARSRSRFARRRPRRAGARRRPRILKVAAAGIARLADHQDARGPVGRRTASASPRPDTG